MLKEGIGDDIYHTHFRNLSSKDGRWWSPDPLEYKFPSVSPYLSMGGNPINFIDPFGDSVFVYGNDKQSFVNDLNKKGSGIIKFTLDDNNQLQYEYINSAPSLFGMTDAEVTIISAINDKKNNVNIFSATNFSTTDELFMDNVDILVGTFVGGFESQIETNEAIQVVNMFQAHLVYDEGLSEPGDVSKHELIEAYFGITLYPYEYLKSHKGSYEIHQVCDNEYIEIRTRVEGNIVTKSLYNTYNNTSVDILTYDKTSGRYNYLEFKEAYNTIINHRGIGFPIIE